MNLLMDPNVTMDEVLELLSQQADLTKTQYATLANLCGVLLEWLYKGGFLPKKTVLTKRGLIRVLVAIQESARQRQGRCMYCCYPTDAEGLCTRSGCAGSD